MSKVMVTFEIEAKGLTLKQAEVWAQQTVAAISKMQDIKARVAAVTIR